MKNRFAAFLPARSINLWNGTVCARTTHDLALIQALPPQCFDVNVSYP